ncbi:MAG: S8 family peptidase, partial [Paracoccaceae bacterium]
MVSVTGNLFRRHKLTALSTTALLLLSGCGGGSSNSLITYLFGPPTPVNPSVLSSFALASFSSLQEAAVNALLTTDARYTNQETAWRFSGPGGPTGPTYNSYPLKNSGAAYAHVAGFDGTGSLVVVADTLLNGAHEVFAGKTIPILSTSSVGADSSFNRHGTFVSSIIAGDSGQFIGIAPGANLAFGTFATDTTLTALTTYADANNAVAINNSWGYPTELVTSPTALDVFSGTSGQAYLNALRNYAIDSVGDPGGVVVFALDNNSRSHATVMEALPYLEPTLEAGWIAVGNAVPVYSGSTITGANLLSNACFEAARWCMMADGTWTAATNLSNSDYGFGTGTSFAVPQVSGALAILQQAFPGLTPHELRVRLLASANNKFFTPDDTVELATGFFKGYSNTYGVGFLDIKSALLPIGPTFMSMADGTAISADKPLVVSGAAMGDAVQRSIAGMNVAVTDALQTGFAMPAEALVTRTAPADMGRTAMARALTTNLKATRTGGTPALRDPFAAFGGRSLQAINPQNDLIASVLVPFTGDNTFGASVSQRLMDGPMQVEFGVKLARDGGAVMGLGGGASTLAALELGLTQDLGGGGFLSLTGEAGLASLSGTAALTPAGAASFNSVTLDIGQSNVFAKGDRLALGIGMPIAVTSGRATITLP